MTMVLVEAVALSSGGKDSITALHKAHEMGYKIKAIVTVIPEDPESMLYHTHNVSHVDMIAESIGVDWVPLHAGRNREEETLLEGLKRVGGEMLVTGGISSTYQKTRFERIAEAAGMKMLSPLWGLTSRQVYENILKTGVDAIVVAVAALGLNEEWLGRHLDRENVEKLLLLSEKYRFNPVGEGGDLDSFVLDAPLYRKKLMVVESEKRWERESGVLDIIRLEALPK